MALPFSDTVDRTLERLRTAFVDTARGAREAVGAPLRPDLPDDDIPRLKGRIDACLEGKGGETARRGRAAELGQAYLSLSPAGRKKFLLTLARDYGLPREAALKTVEKWRASKDPARALRRELESPAVRLLREFVGRTAGREVRGRPARRAIDAGPQRSGGQGAERGPALAAGRLVRRGLPRSACASTGARRPRCWKSW